MHVFVQSLITLKDCTQTYKIVIRQQQSRRSPMTTIIIQKYTQLSSKERDSIARLMHMRCSIREIARNGGMRIYDEEKAILIEKKRRKACHVKQRLTDEQRTLVHKYLEAYYSPEQIAGTLALHHPEHAISHESIYQYIYKIAPYLTMYLRRTHKKRKKRGNAYSNRGIGIPYRVSIHERGDISDEYGHWEADLVGSYSSATVLVLVEKRTKKSISIKVNDKKAQTIHDALVAFFTTVPASLRKSITYDNGKENVLHYKINEAFQMRSYFCDPYSAWQKGLVENTIGLFRQFFPKKTNFMFVDESDILKAQALINNRPRKSLGYKTPSDIFSVALRT